MHLPAGSGTDGKVIYPTREAAEAAARELESLGARRLRPYLCARSRHGHFHLTTDRAAVPVHGASRRRCDRPTPRRRPTEPSRSCPVDDVSALHRRIPRQARGR